MAANEIRGIDSIGHLGWWLVCAFVLANGAILSAVTSPTPASSLRLPALALLALATTLPSGMWTTFGARRVAVATGRIVAAAALLASWAAAVGAAEIGWVGASGATALFFGWVAVLATVWVRLRRLPLLTIASVTIAVGLAATALLVPVSGGLALSLTPALVLTAGVHSAAFMPAVMLGGLTVLVSSLVRLALAVSRLRGADPMHGLAASFAGLCGFALVGTVVTSTSEIAQEVSVGGLAPLGAGLAVSGGLMTVGAVVARGTTLSRRGPLLTSLALLAVITGGWFTFTVGGLAVVPALVLVLLATVLGLVAGLAWASGVVRDGHRLRAQFARPGARHTAPAATTTPAAAPHGTIASPQHATG